MGLDLLLLGISLGPVIDLLIRWLPSERVDLRGVVKTLSLVAKADLALLITVRELLSLDLLCFLVVLLLFFPHRLPPALLALATHSTFSVLLVTAKLTDLFFLELTVVVGFVPLHEGDRAFSSTRTPDLDAGGTGNREADIRALLLPPADLKLRLSVISATSSGMEKYLLAAAEFCVP